MFFPSQDENLSQKPKATDRIGIEFSLHIAILFDIALLGAAGFRLLIATDAQRPADDSPIGRGSRSPLTAAEH